MACHNPTSNPTLSPERVHWNQNEENAAKYKMNIEDVTYTPSATAGGTSTVTVKYFLSDPTNNNAAYNLTVSDNGTPCASPTSCSSEHQVRQPALRIWPIRTWSVSSSR